MSASNTEQEQIEQLSSDKRSLRIQAIVKLTRAGSTEAALQALTPLVTHGDREESFFATQAISKISQKLGINIETVLKNAQSSQSTENPANRVYTVKDFLEARPDTAPALLQFIRTRPNEIPEDALPSVGVFLGKFGDKSDTPFIQNYLKQHHDNLTLPYISAAEKIDPSMLPPVLPYLLASNESLVRSRAVMALRKIDQIEAERHFLNLLASKQAENRLAALEISFLFPFDRVKDYILALLSEEKDLDVFKACATVLASNPSQEIALRILDTVESLPANQRKPATTIFNIVSAAITSAKVLPPEKATPQALVNSWKEQRLQNFLNDLEIQLSTTTGSRREAVIGWIEKNRNMPQVSDFIEHLAVNPQTEDVYQRLTNQNSADNLLLPNIDSIISQSEQAKSATPIKALEKKEHYSTNSTETTVTEPEVTPEEAQANAPLPDISQESEQPVETQEVNDEKAQINYLKNLEINEFPAEKNKIIELAESSFTSVPLRAEALNTLLRLSPNVKIKPYGIKALGEDDGKLRAAGFKILERVAPDVLKEQLSDLLLSNDTNLRVRAIRFGLKVDRVNAIAALEKLVSSQDQNTRSNAMSCLALCPFEEVYVILMRALINETHPLIAKQITAIFISNPDPVILKMLDKLSVVTKNPSLEMVISQARTELEETLSTLPADMKTSNLQEIDIFEKNLDSNNEDKPYSVENVRKLTKNKKNNTTQDGPKSGFYAILAWLFENPAISISCILGILLIVLAFAAFSEKDGLNIKKYTQENRSKERALSGKGSKIPSSFRMNKPCTISGKITNIISEVSVVINHSGRDVMIKFKNNEVKNFRVGDTVSVTCTPYRENPSGVILSNGSKITKVSESKK